MESILLFVLGVLLFVVGLIVSVALHELGHLSFAKLFGVQVRQYMVGFGKTLWSFRRGGTEYGVKPILLGGYIAMAGMYPPRTKDGRPKEATTAMFDLTVQEGEASDLDGVDTTTRGNRQFYALASWKRILVMLAGPVMNLLIGFVLIALMVVAFGVPRSTATSLVDCVPAVQDGSCSAGSVTPAAAAGVEAGDVIVAVDGLSSPTPDQVTAAFQKAPGASVPVTVRRDGQEIALSITPQAQTRQLLGSDGQPLTAADGTVRTTTVGVVGIAVQQKLVPQPVSAAVGLTGEQIQGTVGVFLTLPQRMVAVWNAAFGGEERGADSPVGLIGVGRAVGTVTSLSGVPVADKVYSILGILASLNISLFVLNLVPLLPLDGGHILGALWDALRRGIAKVTRRPQPRPVDITRFTPVTLVVVALLGSMTLLLAYADIFHPVNLFG